MSAALGAELKGLDLAASLDAATVAAVRRAWLDHGVLLVRGQSLTPAALAAFAARFGELEPPPANEAGTCAELGGQPVWYISNVVENGRPIGSLGAGEAEWHTDMSYLPEPPTASVLYAREVPPSGGDTSFYDIEAVLAALPVELRRRIDGLRLRHDASTTSAGELRRGASPVTDVRSTEGAVHPLVRTHPETGRRSLFLGRRRNAYVEGLPVDDSEALLDEIWAIVREPRFAWTLVWSAGDLLMWDNRRLMHRRDAFDPACRRVMLRCQVRGDRPS